MFYYVDVLRVIMKELKTEIIVENNVTYFVSTYTKNKEEVVIWRNEEGNIHRYNKPAIFIYNCSQRLKSWLYFKNGLLHSYNPSKAAIFFRSKNFRLWNFKIWANEGRIHRENKPAIKVTGRSSNNCLYPALNGYFRNNLPCPNSKASLIFHDHNSIDKFESTLVILNDFESYKGYNGYNLINFNYEGKLLAKYRSTFSAKEELKQFFYNLYQNNKNKDSENIESTLLSFIGSFMSIRQNNFTIKTDFYYDLPHKVLFYVFSRKEYVWMNQKGIHRSDKPAKISWNDKQIEECHYKENIPYEDIYTPFKTISDKEKNLIDFEFFNKDIDCFYKEQNLTPSQLSQDEKELLELNFSY